MSRNLLDPVIIETLRHQPVQIGGAVFNWGNLFGKFRMGTLLSILIPTIILLFIAFVIKVKWDKKNGKYKYIRI